MKKETVKNVYQTYDYTVKAPAAKKCEHKPQKSKGEATVKGGKMS